MDSRFEPQETQDPINPEAQRMLNRYLERTCTPNSASAPSQKYDELRAEMSEHLLALAAAHEELGSSPDEAMRAALKQFGEANRIGKAVSREIENHPSFLGSPHTVSIIGGLLVNWATLIGATCLLSNPGQSVFSPEGQVLSLVIGCITGSVVWRRHKSIGQAALWNARFCAGATVASTGMAVLFAIVYSIIATRSAARIFNWEWLKAAVPVLLQWIAIATAAGAFSGALTGIWCRVVRKHLTDNRGEPTPGKRRRISA